MKSGWQTTEFWLTVFTSLTSLVGTFASWIPSPYGLIISAIVTCGYTISRGIAKQGQ